MRSELVRGAVEAPEVSVRWYLEVVEFADETPEPVRWFAAHFTEGSVVVLGLMLLAAGWGRLRGAPGQRGAVLMAPMAVVASYALSEFLKTVVDQARPCHDLIGVAIVAGQCPPTGDWSFPSNHATVAAALATATILLRPRFGLLAVPLAVLAAFSRTFVGVHYPHDVAAGVLLGTVVTAVVLSVTPTAPGRPSRRRRDPARAPGAPGRQRF